MEWFQGTLMIVIFIIIDQSNIYIYICLQCLKEQRTDEKIIKILGWEYSKSRCLVTVFRRVRLTVEQSPGTLPLSLVGSEVCGVDR